MTSVSTNAINAHEVHPTFLNFAEVYCDYRDTTPAAAGEMRLAAKTGWSPDSICGDLAELETLTCPAPSGDKPVFFRSIDLGLEDIFMARAVYKATQAKPTERRQ
ncbi:hypothetical protein OEZ49_20910 [Ruegeria sp. WL0004]|uniref:Ornithine cyclodeaminase n=1 Tax=Ruegeria marisflavi TaxID=2984152 RepID=A0ABT2WWF8_9RHOB|nr:hypothetical protein [Ruegeria sp. WL0004]